ncbi:MAG: peptide chain release factor N(5)-glutamine methyltransferase [Cyclobacteriaceae bacterium]
MKSVKTWVKEIADKLLGVYDAQEAENVARFLLEDMFDVNRMDFFTEKKISVDQARLSDYVGRLQKSEPVQYITGVTEFYGRKFEVSPSVLIPRPETEELVKMIIDANDLVKPMILDVGTGSGCIAISLALELNTKVMGTDISPKAIEIAGKNTVALGAETKFIVHNILRESLPCNNLDILISNPPYIPEKDKSSMHKNVLGFEPETALFVPDNDPLIFYRKIAEKGLESLKAGGRLYFEIHEAFGNKVNQLIQEYGYSNVQIHKDMQGKDRMIIAINSANR